MEIAYIEWTNTWSQSTSRRSNAAPELLRFSTLPSESKVLTLNDKSSWKNRSTWRNSSPTTRFYFHTREIETTVEFTPEWEQAIARVPIEPMKSLGYYSISSNTKATHAHSSVYQLERINNHAHHHSNWNQSGCISAALVRLWYTFHRRLRATISAPLWRSSSYFPSPGVSLVFLGSTCYAFLAWCWWDVSWAVDAPIHFWFSLPNCVFQ